MAVPIVVFVPWPHALIVLANSLLGLVGRDPLPLDLTRAELATLLGISLAGWLLFSLGFTALALTFLPAGDVLGDRLPHVMAAYPLAFAIGFVSLITPSGLAVREGTDFCPAVADRRRRPRGGASRSACASGRLCSMGSRPRPRCCRSPGARHVDGRRSYGVVVRTFRSAVSGEAKGSLYIP